MPAITLDLPDDLLARLTAYGAETEQPVEAAAVSLLSFLLTLTEDDRARARHATPCTYGALLRRFPTLRAQTVWALYDGYADGRRALSDVAAAILWDSLPNLKRIPGIGRVRLREILALRRAEGTWPAPDGTPLPASLRYRPH